MYSNPIYPCSSILNTFLKIYFMYMDILPPYMSVYHMCAQESQKRTSDLLKLELQTVVSYHMGAGIQPRSSARASSDLKH